MLIIILILKPDLDVIDVKFDMPYNVRVTTRHTTNEYGEIHSFILFHKTKVT